MDSRLYTRFLSARKRPGRSLKRPGRGITIRSESYGGITRRRVRRTYLPASGVRLCPGLIDNACGVNSCGGFAGGLVCGEARVEKQQR